MHNTTPEMRIAKLYDEVRRLKGEVGELRYLAEGYEKDISHLYRKYNTVEAIALSSLSVLVALMVLMALGVIS